MTEFDSFMSGAFEEALEIGGTEEFTLGGTPYQGSFDEQISEQRGLEQGGMAILKSARIIAAKTQFEAAPVLGTVGAVRGQNMCLARLGEDSVFYTLDFAEVD